MLTLGIETSCDETAAAVVEGDARGVMVVRSNVISSQIDLHSAAGGVVPEIASRAHLAMLEPVLSQALDDAGIVGGDIDAVAATSGPGLIGALLVGVSAGKALSVAWDVPYVAVNHMEGHLFATLLENPDLELPVVVLLVSGGHTMLVEMRALGDYRLLGSTVDDAAGEAFDKVARYLGLGYPGGPVIDRISRSGDPAAIRFPRALMDDGLDFSFSGMKTAVINYVRKNPEADNADLAAGFQEAVVDVLVGKAVSAAVVTGAQTVCLGGGVAANSRLRQRLTEVCGERGINALIPNREYCTDNAAMIAAAGGWRLSVDGPTSIASGASPSGGASALFHQ